MPDRPNGSTTAERNKDTLASHLGQLADGVTKLVANHMQLARVELQQDAKVIGGNAARVAAFAVFTLIGYALLCVALAIALSSQMGAAFSFALVGGVNVLGGGAGIALAVSKIRSRQVLAQSLQALASDKALSRELRDAS